MKKIRLHKVLGILAATVLASGLVMGCDMKLDDEEERSEIAGYFNLTSIAVKGQTTKFTEGDKFKTDGAVVTATYADNSTKEVTASFTGFEVGKVLVTSDSGKTINVSYTENGIEKTTSYTITVEEKVAEVSVPAPSYSARLDGADFGVKIVGAGSYVEDETFGQVFKNVTTTAGNGTDYLQLPENLFELTGVTTTKEMTIGFWVKSYGEEISNWSPLFTAQPSDAVVGTFAWPFLAVEARIELGWNITGYYDPTNGSHNNLTWLTDNTDWHYVTVTISKSEDKIVYYIDGVIKFTVTSEDAANGTVEGILSEDALKMTKVALGGMQACSWNDPDLPCEFAKFSVWDSALSEAQIKKVVSTK